jgi:GTP cyclohydrolase I
MLKPVKEGIAITKVGIREYDSPVDVVRKDGTAYRAKGTFSCYVSLEPHLKGTHMSRLAEVIQETTLNRPIDNKALLSISQELLTKVDTHTVYLKLKFDYPLKQQSLVSRNKETGEFNFGWMYYPTTIELKQNVHGELKGFYTIEYLYSSTCPCSFMMTEDWRQQTGHLATPHAQRSRMATTVEFDLNSSFHIEDLILLHREAIRTEVLGAITKRSDEMTFGILNAEQPMFVEDATRYMYEVLNKHPDILDFSVVSNHEESLHPHQATAIINKGVPNGLK